MRAWELLGLDEAAQRTGSRPKGSAKLGSKNPPKLKRIKPIEPEGAFELKTSKDADKAHLDRASKNDIGQP